MIRVLKQFLEEHEVCIRQGDEPIKINVNQRMAPEGILLNKGVGWAGHMGCCRDTKSPGQSLYEAGLSCSERAIESQDRWFGQPGTDQVT